MIQLEFTFLTERNKVYKMVGEGLNTDLARHDAWRKVQANNKKTPPTYSGFSYEEV